MGGTTYIKDPYLAGLPVFPQPSWNVEQDRLFKKNKINDDNKGST